MVYELIVSSAPVVTVDAFLIVMKDTAVPFSVTVMMVPSLVITEGAGVLIAVIIIVDISIVLLAGKVGVNVPLLIPEGWNVPAAVTVTAEVFTVSLADIVIVDAS